MIKIDNAVVCPSCFRSPPGASLSREITDRYGNKRRTYYGWCLNCKKGFEVEQYHAGGKWLIHKYRYWDPIRLAGTYVPDWWTTINDIPVAPVVTGPGGDYDVGHEIPVSNIMRQATRTIDNIVAMIKSAQQKK